MPGKNNSCNAIFGEDSMVVSLFTFVRNIKKSISWFSFGESIIKKMGDTPWPWAELPKIEEWYLSDKEEY